MNYTVSIKIRTITHQLFTRALNSRVKQLKGLLATLASPLRSEIGNMSLVWFQLLVQLTSENNWNS
uniref:Uncharacterized protein n=1 Tax=Utricularia reniformis TaxID=192314 RepID=A0A1Y0B0B3_9LAMI|nr:hypothetical protein AEK19_MT0556 [Utricularia reniformis]ART30811.1 hypothetical protein AEK19_MT0556 [Utricularia reniformis]